MAKRWSIESDKNFSGLKQTNNLLLPSNSRTVTHIVLPNQLHHFASNEDFLNNSRQISPLNAKSKFARNDRKLAPKTTIDALNKRKMEANNFFKDSKLLSPSVIQSTDKKSSINELEPIDVKSLRKSHFNHEDVNVFKISDDKVKNEPKYSEILSKIFDSCLFQCLVTTFIFYALFGMDIKFLCFDLKDDLGFDILTILALSTFTFEIFLNIIVKKQYMFSYFFWLDTFSTITLIMDLSLINELIL